MKVWLDDIREAPEGWVWCKDAEHFRSVVINDPWNCITHISFDHDLGDTNIPEITGYTCLCWVEKRWWNDPAYKLPVLTVHSANPVGRSKMQQVIDKMEGR